MCNDKLAKLQKAVEDAELVFLEAKAKRDKYLGQSTPRLGTIVVSTDILYGSGLRAHILHDNVKPGEHMPMITKSGSINYNVVRDKQYNYLPKNCGNNIFLTQEQVKRVMDFILQIAKED